MASLVQPLVSCSRCSEWFAPSFGVVHLCNTCAKDLAATSEEQRLKIRAEELGCSVALVKHIEWMEKKIEDLEEKEGNRAYSDRMKDYMP